jgi:hypothetical protein
MSSQVEGLKMSYEEIKQKFYGMESFFEDQGDAWDWMKGTAIPELLGLLLLEKDKNYDLETKLGQANTLIESFKRHKHYACLCNELEEELEYYQSQNQSDSSFGYLAP